jgi:hypothetical protein
VGVSGGWAGNWAHLRLRQLLLDPQLVLGGLLLLLQLLLL